MVSASWRKAVPASRDQMLLPIDGVQHRWLGADGPRFDLLLALDHASGTVPAAPFDHAADPSHAPAPDSVSVRSTVVGLLTRTPGFAPSGVRSLPGARRPDLTSHQLVSTTSCHIAPHRQAFIETMDRNLRSTLDASAHQHHLMRNAEPSADSAGPDGWGGGDCCAGRLRWNARRNRCAAPYRSRCNRHQ